ncbi:MAG: EamA family transporter [Bacteroidota bacterium]|nr:EamA family transporter [Bacteroidota bacterium]
MQHNRTLYRSLFFLMAIIWGVTWTLYVVALRSFSPMLIAGLRNVLGAAALFGVLKVQRVPLPKKFSEWKFLFYVGLLWIAIPYAMVFWGVQYTSSGMASVLNGTNPFFVALFSYFFLKNEKMTTAKILGLIVGFIGVVIIFSQKMTAGSERSLLADTLVFIAAVFTGLAMVVAKRFGASYHSVVLIAVMMLFGGGTLIAASALFDQPVRFIVSFESISVLLFLSLLSSAFGFVAYMWLLKRVDAVKLSMVAFLVPVIAIALGLIFLNEAVTALDIAGTVCVLSGLFVVNVLEPLVKLRIER